MKCPLCNVEARIKSNKPVQREDGTFAYRMDFECRTAPPLASKKCPNFGHIIGTEYDPFIISQDE